MKAAVAVSRILRASKHRGYVQPNLLDTQSKLSRLSSTYPSKLSMRRQPPWRWTSRTGIPGMRSAADAPPERRLCKGNCVSSAPTACNILFRFSLAREYVIWLLTQLPSWFFRILPKRGACGWWPPSRRKRSTNLTAHVGDSILAIGMTWPSRNWSFFRPAKNTDKNSSPICTSSMHKELRSFHRKMPRNPRAISATIWRSCSSQPGCPNFSTSCSRWWGLRGDIFLAGRASVRLRPSATCCGTGWLPGQAKHAFRCAQSIPCKAASTGLGDVAVAPRCSR